MHTIWIRLKFLVLDSVEDQKARLVAQMTTIQGCNDQICMKQTKGESLRANKNTHNIKDQIQEEEPYQIIPAEGMA